MFGWSSITKYDQTISSNGAVVDMSNNTVVLCENSNLFKNADMIHKTGLIFTTIWLAISWNECLLSSQYFSRNCSEELTVLG